MTKVLIVGIDALDSDTILKNIDRLPNLKNIIHSMPDGFSFDGVFPPDSPTSWASIFTGLNPAKHGILLFVDPLKKVGTMVSKDVDDASIRGKTVWDIAGREGKKVCIIPHLLGYPAWDVNGIMASRSSVTKDVSITPEKIMNKLDASKLRWDVALFPSRDKEKYLSGIKQQIARESEFALNLFSEQPWDLFFVSFGELDVISYSFWNYYDEKDPSYPGDSKYKNTIPEFYTLFDKIIGKFEKAMDGDTVLMVVSDHGIGSRPLKLININEYLRLNGLLVGSQTNASSTNSVSKRVKRMALASVDKLDLGNLAARFLKLVPSSKNWILSADQIDFNLSKAHLVDQSGIKNYPYGGININCTNPEEYEEIKNKIVIMLRELKNPENGLPIFRWVKWRNDLYSGPLINKYPDILFELVDDYGAGTSIFSPLYGKSLTHNIAPGCHKQHHATFLFKLVNNRTINKLNMNLCDVTPTVLSLLDINLENIELDGRSIFDE